MNTEQIVNQVRDTLVKAGSSFREDKIRAYRRAIEKESSEQSRWVMEQILLNAEAAEKNASPLCDDTGIPHLVLDIGPNQALTGELMDAIQAGVAEGLRALPGRPMGIMGGDEARLDQSGGLDPDPAGVLAAPLQVRRVEEDVLRLHILMQGGGPAIRGRTYRVYHKHSVSAIVDEIVKWAAEGVHMLGCSPCTLTIGIGRSQYEAAALMEQAQVDGNFDVQSALEKEITDRVNRSNVGALGLHGDTSVLATFLKVGPQRASGVRVVSLRPCCCFEPRLASVDLSV
ncbi:MAG: fumarate hydratase [Clostridia bacterium]|nr:fumarate hydratase [Clostridia bacterium]